MPPQSPPPPIWTETNGPAVILVEPQLGENIGTVARAMANFGLKDLRLVRPRDGWPNEKAVAASSGATMVLDNVRLFDNLDEAIGDLSLLFATTARQHGQAKPVIGPREAAERIAPLAKSGARTGILFGRERNGLQSDEVALADAIITFPVNPAFSSFNLAQAVLLIAYEWFSLATSAALPYQAPEAGAPPAKAQMTAFFATLESELDRVAFFRPPEKRESMVINLRNIILRMTPSRQDIQTLHGAINALVEGRKGPASGATLSNEDAERLRALFSEGTTSANPIAAHGPVRGLARLLRRNPTVADQTLWDRLKTDRRFAGKFRRAEPIGPHVADFVAFASRLVLLIVPQNEDEEAFNARTSKEAWLRERGYHVQQLKAADLTDGDLEAVLERIASQISL